MIRRMEIPREREITKSGSQSSPNAQHRTGEAVQQENAIKSARFDGQDEDELTADVRLQKREIARNQRLLEHFGDPAKIGSPRKTPEQETPERLNHRKRKSTCLPDSPADHDFDGRLHHYEHVHGHIVRANLQRLQGTGFAARTRVRGASNTPP